MSDNNEKIYNQPEHEAQAVLSSRARELSDENPETEVVRNKRKKEKERVKITDEAAREAENSEEGPGRFKRLMKGETIDEAIAQGKFPNLFKPKGPEKK